MAKKVEKTTDALLNKRHTKDQSEAKPKKASGKKVAAVKPAKKAKEKKKKEKKVRITFSLSPSDCLVLTELRQKCRIEGLPYRKADFVSAGLTRLSALSMTNLLKLLAKQS